MIDITESLFKAISHLDNAKLLASHMPIGRLWSSAFDPNTNFGKLILGLAVEHYRLGLLTEKVATEMDIRQASDLLVDWEKSVGLPNKCFTTTGTYEERRRNVELIFSNFRGVQTEEDFIRVAAEFGYTITIRTGVEAGGFAMSFPLVFFSGAKAAKFTIVVTTDFTTEDFYFPLGFPLPFSAGGTTLLRCIFEALAPANVEILFLNL